MKRTTLLTLVVLAGWAAAAAAQTPEPTEQPKANRVETQERQGSGEATVQKSQTAGPAARGTGAFVDADGDGICDNFQGQGRGRGRGAANGRRGRGPGAAVDQVG